jgi:hypothetical protein
LGRGFSLASDLGSRSCMGSKTWCSRKVSSDASSDSSSPPRPPQAKYRKYDGAQSDHSCANHGVALRHLACLVSADRFGLVASQIPGSGVYEMRIASSNSYVPTSAQFRVNPQIAVVVLDSGVEGERQKQ